MCGKSATLIGRLAEARVCGGSSPFSGPERSASSPLPGAVPESPAVSELLQHSCERPESGWVPKSPAVSGLLVHTGEQSESAPVSDSRALLECWSTQVSDLGPLASLSALRWLSCFDTRVSDLSPLGSLRALESMDCSHTKVSDLTSLIVLPSLKWLAASECCLADVLRSFVRSGTLEELILHEATNPRNSSRASFGKSLRQLSRRSAQILHRP